MKKLKPVKVPSASRYKTAVGNLQAAFRLISRPGRWTQNKLAVDCNGKRVRNRSNKAVAFCALGAVRFIDGPGEKAAVRYLSRAAAVMNGHPGEYGSTKDIFMVNDLEDKPGRVIASVKRMFRNAIKLAKQGK